MFAAGTVSQARQTARDTVEKYLNFVPASRSLGRPYLIWIGAAWTMLVADVGGAWHERVAANGLVPTVAAMTGPVAFERSVTFRALLDSAEATVSALARQARLAEESRLRAFSAQRGIVVRLTWVTVNGLSEVSRGSGQLTESVLTWPGGMNTITARGIVLRGCCPEFLSVVVPRDSLFFSVDGRALPIDMAGSARGRIEFRGAGLHAMLESGAVTVRHDSVTIQVERR